jgi:hypothetical protein
VSFHSAMRSSGRPKRDLAYFGGLEVLVVVENLENNADKADKRYEITFEKKVRTGEQRNKVHETHTLGSEGTGEQATMSLMAIRNKPPVSNMFDT